MATLNQPLSPTTEYGPSSLAGSVKGGMNGKSTVPVPVAPHTRTHSAPFPAYSAMAGATAAFPGPRSPPKKSTQHVPCRFFGSGQCQAGNACQFSHDLDLSQNAVCSYFKKVSQPLVASALLHGILTGAREAASSVKAALSHTSYQTAESSIAQPVVNSHMPDVLRKQCPPAHPPFSPSKHTI